MSDRNDAIAKPDLWTGSDIQAVTGGTLKGAWSISGISIDTRSLQPGDLFVPIKDQRDGHDFIPMAREKQAGAIMSEHQDEAGPAICVPDSVAALRKLGRAACERSLAKRVAITGSVGKTSLKEAVAAICQDQGKTHKSLKSFNNHWGVPLTLATMLPDTDYGVFELGMNHAGELTDLSHLVKPHIALITKIAPAHLAHFDSVDAIADAKAEIFSGLVKGGIAILNRDDPYFGYLSEIASQHAGKILTFGTHPASDIQYSLIDSTATGVTLQLGIDGKTFPLSLAMSGAHWGANAACAMAVASAIGLDMPLALQSLAGLKPLAGRGEVRQACIADTAFTLIDESYNANPESMRAAISTLSSYSTGRKVAVLGDMLELGETELQHHANLAEVIKDAKVDEVLLIGPRMQALFEALPACITATHTKEINEAQEMLKSMLREGDIVLMKGSNASGVGALVKSIQDVKLSENNNKKDSRNVL